MTANIGKRGGAGAYRKRKPTLFRICVVCQREFFSKRPDAKTCSGKCRVKLHRITKLQDHDWVNYGDIPTSPEHTPRVIVINTRAGRIEQKVMWS